MTRILPLVHDAATSGLSLMVPWPPRGLTAGLRLDVANQAKARYVTLDAWFNPGRRSSRTCTTLRVSWLPRSQASTARTSTARSSSAVTGTTPTDSGSWNTAQEWFSGRGIVHGYPGEVITTN